MQAVAPRFDVQAVDSFSLGQTIELIAYPGNHVAFEAPQLAAAGACAAPGRSRSARVWPRRSGSAPAQTLALALPSGTELRLRIAGVVSSLDHDGRVAYVPAAALLRADPSAPSLLAIRLTPPPTRVRSARRCGARRRAGGRRRRHRTRCPAGRDPADDHPRGGDRRRARLPVRADPGLRADRAGAPADDRRAARLRRGRRRPSRGCWPAPRSARAPGGGGRSAARAARARPGALPPRGQLRDARRCGPPPPRSRSPSPGCSRAAAVAVIWVAARPQRESVLAGLAA